VTAVPKPTTPCVLAPIAVPTLPAEIPCHLSGYTGLHMTGTVIVDELTAGDDFLTYEWEGELVPILHGFPVRAVFPAPNGNKWVAL
jgi:DMSO/TMAO reductase YedYZ molybdopterin-dependent catalytic subunit